MRSSDYIKPSEIIAEAAESINDADFTHGVGKPTYELYLHRVMEDLALTTFFNKVTVDIFNWSCNGSPIIVKPKNIFNIREMYLFNSSCDKEKKCPQVS